MYASGVGSSHLIVEEFPNNLGPAIGFREATGGELERLAYLRSFCVPCVLDCDLGR